MIRGELYQVNELAINHGECGHRVQFQSDWDAYRDTTDGTGIWGS